MNFDFLQDANVQSILKNTLFGLLAILLLYLQVLFLLKLSKRLKSKIDTSSSPKLHDLKFNSVTLLESKRKKYYIKKSSMYVCLS